MRTRNNKSNLIQSKTNNETNCFNKKNDINFYLNKYIYKKIKTRNANICEFSNKKTFNLSSQKYDINGSMTILNNNSKSKNFNKYIGSNKDLNSKSRNRIPSCFKGRPNTIFKNNNNNILMNKIQKNKIITKKIRENNSNLIYKKRNYSMIGYGNMINTNLNNLTERENNYNKFIKDNEINKTPIGNKIKTNNNALSGMYTNISNLEQLSKNEANSERYKKIENYNKNNNDKRNMSQNKFGNIKDKFLINNGLYKSKLSFINSHSLSKSKSKSKNKNKTKVSHKMPRAKSNFSNSFKTTLIEDISKLKKIGKKQKNFFENNKSKILIKEMNIMQKKNINNNHITNINNSNIINENFILINNNEKSSGASTLRTRNLKTYNILSKTNSVDVERNKINDINNKENYSINRKSTNGKKNIITNKNDKINNINLNNNQSLKYKRNSFGNCENNKINYMKKLPKKNMSKYNTEKNLIDNKIFSNGCQKLYKENKKFVKNK